MSTFAPSTVAWPWLTNCRAKCRSMIRSALRVNGMPARRERRTLGPVYLTLDLSLP